MAGRTYHAGTCLVAGTIVVHSLQDIMFSCTAHCVAAVPQQVWPCASRIFRSILILLGCTYYEGSVTVQ